MTINSVNTRDLPNGFSTLVIQMGARRRYELARMLHDYGALAALHTSSAWADGDTPSWFYRRLTGVTDNIVERRTIPQIPKGKIRISFLPELVGKFLELLGKSEEERYRAEDRIFGISARIAGLAGASIILNTSGNGGINFLRWARQKGARIASDIVITPCFYDIVAEELRRWPGWEDGHRIDAEADIYRRRIEDLVEVSDLLLSPSEAVDEGLATIKSFEPRKLARIPYGLGSFGIGAGTPVPRRVLFAGNVALRKGLPYLAEAAKILKPLGYDIRVAGKMPAGVQERPECAALTFLGHLGPNEMVAEFSCADLFCLPSLAEGMPSVTIEALSFGIPCIVTRSAGSPVRHGHDGAIVPERDGASIAEAIRSIAEDRDLRTRMSESALATSANHSLTAVGRRLYQTLADLALKDG